MMMAEHGHKHGRDGEMRRKNLRTALAVGGLALFFFVLLFVKRLWLN
ncbi:hypothetical protein ACFQ09_11895 [Massilia norwichensis]|jgi:hypothetical protein|uniref:Uncharacterized protein n=1 Tax=Massilia norwichensis TaxID=1442366 RepID=A0ABT2A476_9BURK|nr:hypothetical protein [Massilia norwichensis]MCS0588992.1 hypothetical protein [Massilia norwichensis]